MNALDVAYKCLYVAQWALVVLYIIGLARGVPRPLLVQMFAPWTCCAYTALAVLALMQGKQMSSGVYAFLSASWAVDWWRNRPPRPPRLRRVLRAVHVGA